MGRLRARPRVIPLEQFKSAYADVASGKMTAGECKKALGLTHSTYYRYVGMVKEAHAVVTN